MSENLPVIRVSLVNVRKLASDMGDPCACQKTLNSCDMVSLCAESVVTKARLVFSDVVDEFHKLSLVKERYEQWKWGFSESYKQAYISLCLPKLFDPFAKLEMIDWNPLEVRGCN